MTASDRIVRAVTCPLRQGAAPHQVRPSAPRTAWIRHAAAIALLAAAASAPAAARTLVVGEGGAYPTLEAASRRAGDGDTIRLLPGEYFECASLTQHRLVLEGPGATLTDRTCEGKALLVLRGDGITVRDLTLARARVPDGNGAGIRLEGQGLTLERVRFDNDQVGLLGSGAGAIRIVGCTFEGGGVGGDRPLAAVMAGPVPLLRIEDSVFGGGKGGQVSSAAVRTELVGNRIANGAEPSAAPPVLFTGGSLLMQDNVLALGPAPPPRDAAVMALGARAELRGNRLENATGRPQALLLDWTSATPVLAGNVVGPGDAVVSSSGFLRHRVADAARSTLGGVRWAAQAAKRGIKGVLGW